MMKKSATQYAAAALGMILILAGVVWLCRTVSTAGRLQAAAAKRTPAKVSLAAARGTPPATPRVDSPIVPLESTDLELAPVQMMAALPSLPATSPAPLAARSVEPSAVTLELGEMTEPPIPFAGLSEPEPLFSETTLPAPFPESSYSESPEPLSGTTSMESVSLFPSESLDQTISAPAPLAVPSESPLGDLSLFPANLSPLSNGDEPVALLPLYAETAPRTELSPPTVFAPPTEFPPSERPISAEPPRLASRSDSFSGFGGPRGGGNFSVAGRPGSRELEGPQRAELILEKQLPDEIQVGREDLFRILLKNAGNAPARNVSVREIIPTGTELTATVPRIDPSANGELIWTGFDLAPGEERAFEYRLVPQTEGEIGSVASVSFSSEASGRTVCTRPQVKLQVDALREVLIGENIQFNIQISNPGSGIAREVMLSEDVPKQLRHPGGASLNNRIGDISPGETKTLTLTLSTLSAGPVRNIMKVTADGGLMDETVTELVVNAPELALEIVGAKTRYLERNAVYKLKVWNPGTASAPGLKLTAELPRGMKFVATNNEGAYQASTHSVHWELAADLPPNIAPGEIELTLLPVDLGSGKLLFRGEGGLSLAASVSQEIEIDGMSAVSYEVASKTDPVEVGRNASYEIRIANRGTKESTNIQTQVLLPEPMTIVESDGPTRAGSIHGGVVFAPLAQLGAKEEVVYKLTTRCNLPGDHRIRVQVSSDDMEPLVKEESVRVYGEN